MVKYISQTNQTISRMHFFQISTPHTKIIFSKNKSRDFMRFSKLKVLYVDHNNFSYFGFYEFTKGFYLLKITKKNNFHVNWNKIPPNRKCKVYTKKYHEFLYLTKICSAWKFYYTYDIKKYYQNLWHTNLNKHENFRHKQYYQNLWYTNLKRHENFNSCKFIRTQNSLKSPRYHNI